MLACGGEQIKKAYEEQRKERLNMFMAGFNVISDGLREAYQCLTLGGDAELELVNGLDPFAEVRLLLQRLSGGNRLLD